MKIGREFRRARSIVGPGSVSVGYATIGVFLCPLSLDSLEGNPGTQEVDGEEGQQDFALMRRGYDPVDVQLVLAVHEHPLHEHHADVRCNKHDLVLHGNSFGCISWSTSPLEFHLLMKSGRECTSAGCANGPISEKIVCSAMAMLFPRSESPTARPSRFLHLA